MKLFKRVFILTVSVTFVLMGALFVLSLKNLIHWKTAVFINHLFLGATGFFCYLPFAGFFAVKAVIFQRWKKFYERKIILTKGSCLYYCPASDSEKKGAVIICPGGSYHHLGMTNEGFFSARWFNKLGFDTFVLRYRSAFYGYHFPSQFEDIELAVKYVRENAADFSLRGKKITAAGYSAGGHLVLTAAEKKNKLLRPDYVIAVYPVVSMQDDIGHAWSRKSLFPDGITQEQKNLYSIELNVPDDMPPVFLMACRDDDVVCFENSVRLDKALSDKNIPHEFAFYEEGGHGFGMKEGKFLKKHPWNEEKLLPWLKKTGVL